GVVVAVNTLPVYRRVAGRFFFSSRRRHTRLQGDWSSDVCSSDLSAILLEEGVAIGGCVLSRSMATPSSSRIAEARVDLSNAKYLRLARIVSWPGSACPMPATPEISSSGGPSRRQRNF